MLRVGLLLSVVASGAPLGDERRPIRWGIMGTGAIAHDFARVLNAMPDATIAAVGSRTPERAREFAAAVGLAVEESMADGGMVGEEIASAAPTDADTPRGSATDHRSAKKTSPKSKRDGKSRSAETPSGSRTRLCGSYEELAAQDDLDIVYVATPSLRHVADATLCLEVLRIIFFLPTHPFLPYVAPHFSHISPFNLSPQERPSGAVREVDGSNRC